MRHHTTLPILLLALSTASAASAAQSLPYATVATVPASPAPGEPVVLKLTGQWPDGCVPEAGRTKLLTSGTKLQVNFNYSGFSGACTAAVTAWSLDVPVGPLAEGTWTVEVTRTRTFTPPEPIGSGTFRVAPLPVSTVWVPAFHAPGATVTMASNLTAYNGTGSAASVTYAGAWDALGEVPPPAPAPIEADASAILPSHSTLRAGQHVQMLALTAPRRVTFRATLERLETVPEGLPKVPESLGRLELPVFTELFPAGLTAVAGDVSLSASECAEGATNRRRVNLTLFNAGPSPATFRVSAASTATPVTPAEERTYDVPAKSLVQFNEIALAGLPVCEAGGAWFRVTADQPFLAYLSTVRPETLPGVLPYEIFPAKLDR